ncbi:receptor-like protein EIX1 [Carya illinoinensis]|uniref:Leucine-rich repeat-containing N-terminal plant-type domain-containing protein n=1 Tax=Carya illinoinensis TaxID=32201 RepID=A0A8T1QLK6_CARIL|nr:receptor-like protein EIX1 [Carya illinoinensis]KAG6655337.1 hypothetical protein CIPAW_05G209300 [Carya illinoinensis]
MRGCYLPFLLLLLGLLSCNATKLGFSFDLHTDSKVRCIEKERQALLQFKQHLVDPNHWLSSWDSGEDCCKWEGINCSNKTGHVVQLDLRSDWSYAERSTKYLEGEISISLLGLQYLTYLDLSFNNFFGKPFPNFIGSLTRLRYLNLSYTSIAGTIPQQLANLSRLTSLDLKWNDDLTEVYNLDWLIHLSSLKFLDMHAVNLSLVVNWPDKVMMLPSLKHLSLSRCSLSTTTPQLLSVTANSSSQLSLLDLSGNYLNCSIFLWLFNSTTSLVDLYLGDNELQCSIPDAFGSLNSLKTLYLGGNKLVGGIPKSFWNLCSLGSLYLSHNNLGGNLSEFMSNASGCLMDSLQNLQISNNRFTGPLPESIGSLSNLHMLDVSKNSLAGLISDAHFSNLSKLKELYLGSNSLILSFSNDWVPPFQLDAINLSSCRLGSAFPKWLQTQRNYFMLDISNAEISDIIPAWFWDFSPRLSFLNMNNNELHGNLANLSSSRLHEFAIIDLSTNRLDGLIPHFDGLVNVSSLDLSNNRFSGPVSFLCELNSSTLLESLNLSNNTLSGGLPDCWTYISGLVVLNLANNNFSGNIPDSMGSLVSIQLLHLSNNGFVGKIPTSLQNCSQLIIIDLGANNFSGMVPPWIGDSLPNLVILGLRSNQFVGSLPLNLCHLQYIQILDLSLNKIKGAIPECIYNLTAMYTTMDIMSGAMFRYNTSISYMDYASLVWKGREFMFQSSLGLLKIIDLSNNKLHGVIPEGITNLTALVALNLSRNNLSGFITPKIGLLRNLQSLDLSRNQLYGEIPMSISILSFLSQLDLSANNLSGKIPTGTQIQSFDASAFSENPKLCGSPLPKKCIEDPHPIYNNTRGHENQNDRFITKGFYIAAFLGFIGGFWGVCITSLLNIRYIMKRLTSNARMM